MTAAESRYIKLVAKEERGRLLNYIRKQVHSEEDAKDIFQDVMYQFLVGFEDIRRVERITSWLFTVARNKIIDHFRKKRPEPLSDKRVIMDDEDGSGPLMLDDILPALTRDPENEYMRELIWQAIEEALDELPDEQREVFILNEFEDKSFREISGMTGESINTLLSRKRYAVLHLRKKLKDLYNQL